MNTECCASDRGVFKRAVITKGEDGGELCTKVRERFCMMVPKSYFTSLQNDVSVAVAGAQCRGVVKR